VPTHSSYSRFHARHSHFETLEALVDGVESPHHPAFEGAESAIHLRAKFDELLVDVQEPLGYRIVEAREAREDFCIPHAAIVRHRRCPAVTAYVNACSA
jgi:hypothetical protein